MNKITKSIALFGTILLLSGCAGPVIKKVQQSTIEGTVAKVYTEQPIRNALIVESIGRGGFWSEPSTYELRRTYTDEKGRFVLQADPKVLMNVTDPNEEAVIIVFARGYEWVMVTPSKKENAQLEIKLIPAGSMMRDPCQNMYFTGKTCELVRKHMGW